MRRLTLLALMATASGGCFAADWLVLNGASHHFERNGQEERNYGLGLERHYSERWTGSAGIYRNSSGDASVYLASAYTPWRAYGARWGVLGGLVTGYEGKDKGQRRSDQDALTPAILGGFTAAWEGGRIGLNLIFIPAAGGVLFAQVKFPIR